jgi:hypothetical protein
MFLKSESLMYLTGVRVHTLARLLVFTLKTAGKPVGEVNVCMPATSSHITDER